MLPFETEEHKLPELKKLPDNTDNPLIYGYGAAHQAASYCSFESPPNIPRGEWQHGWAPAEHNYHPAAVICGAGEVADDDFFWVSRKDQEEFLQASGVKNVKAIGCNMTYTPPCDVPRLENSLLVMPIRSLHSGEYNWDCDRYVAEIEKIKNDFDVVAACIHPACMLRGDWVDEFEAIGVSVIKGAEFVSENALYRLKWLFSRFEYVTSNAMGSNMGYSAYCGAKFSFYGSYQDMKRESWEHISIFQVYPEILDKKIELISEKSVKAKYPQFFHNHPKDAEIQIEWAKEQLGEDCKLSPEEMIDLFCWPKRNVEIPKLKNNDDYLSELKNKTHWFKDGQEILPDESEKHERKVHHYIIKAGENCPYSQLILANIFLDGIYTDKNEKIAANYAYLAANNGLIEAQHLIGYFYFSGIGLEQSHDEAFQWFSLAAEKKHPDSTFRCGWMLQKGIGCKPDPERANELIPQAAELGSPDAEAFLKDLSIA